MPPSVTTYQPNVQPSDIKEVTLRFPGVRIMWKFTRDTNTLSYEINARAKTLTCRYSAEEIELACKQYQAELIEQ